MIPRGLRGAVLVAAIALAGCSGPAALTPGAAATPIFTQAQADACASDALSIDLGRDAPHARQVRSALGTDITAARHEAAATTLRYVSLVPTFTGTGADADVAALGAALATGAAAFAKPMTLDEFNAAYDAIQNASHAFGDRCRQIQDWVQRIRPMG